MAQSLTAHADFEYRRVLSDEPARTLSIAGGIVWAAHVALAALVVVDAVAPRGAAAGSAARDTARWTCAGEGPQCKHKKVPCGRMALFRGSDGALCNRHAVDEDP
jgi:hypothetical protein